MPGRNDNFVDHAWITTFCDLRFHLYGDDPEEIDIRDIAHALSNQCRFTGHVRKFYSVAQHSIVVFHLVRELGGTKADMRLALLHDASEAYLADMAAPFKAEVKGYYDIEALIEARITQRFNLTEKTQMIKDCDWYALFIEAKALINADANVFLGWDEYGPRAMEFGYKLIPMLPAEAEIRFLEAAKELGLA